MVSDVEVGYLPDGTPLNKAGNNMNHPENIGPDPHVPGLLDGTGVGSNLQRA